MRIAINQLYSNHSGTKLSAMLLAGQASLAAGALVINVLSARALGADGRGHLALLLQLTYIVGAVAILGRDRGYLATLSPARPDLPTATREFRSLLGLPLLICGLAGATTAFVIDGNAGLVGLGTTAVGLLIVLISNLESVAMRTVSIATGSGGGYLICTILSQVLLISLAALYLAHGTSDVRVWLITYGCSALAPILVIEYQHLRPREPGPRPNRDLADGRLLGLKLTPATVAEIVTNRIDRLLLPLFAGYGALGLYVVVATITELINWPIRHYTDSRIPEWARSQTLDQAVMRRIARRTIAYSLIVSGFVGIGIWFMLPILFGTEYAGGRHLVPPLTLAAGVYGLSRVAVGLATARGRPRVVSAINIFGMAASAICYVTLIPRYGATGAAWGTFAGCLVGSIIGLRYLLKRFENSETARASVY